MSDPVSTAVPRTRPARVIAWFYGAPGALWVVILSAILPYAELRNHPFVHDDHDLRGPGSLVAAPDTTPAELWSADLFGYPGELHGHSGYWRPLVLWSYRVEHELTGGSPRATAWLGHVVSIALHAGACVALWALLRALRVGDAGALLGAVLFAVHPVHAEAVAWLSARSELMPPLFVWGALAVTLSAGRPGARHALLGFVACVAALLSKESAVLLVGLWAPIAIAAGHPWRQSLAVPVAAAACALVARASLFSEGFDDAAYAGPADAATRWLTWLSILPDQLRLVIWPGLEATPVHPVDEARRWGAPGVAAGALLLAVGLAASWWAWARRHAVAILGVGLVVGTMVLVAPWTRFPTGYPIVAAPLYERYLYAAALGPVLAVAWWLRDTLERHRGATLALVVALAVGGGLATAERTRPWHDDVAFARAALAAAPESADLWNHLGYHSPPDEALTAFEEALVHDPGHRMARMNRFLVLQGLGDPRGAEAAADLLRRFPEDPHVLYNVGGWHLLEERWAEAAALLRRALETGEAPPGTAEALALCVDRLEDEAG